MNEYGKKKPTLFLLCLTSSYISLFLNLTEINLRKKKIIIPEMFCTELV